jgi:hypothetical protein
MWRGEIKRNNIWGAASHTLKSMEENYIICIFLPRMILPVVLYGCETLSVTLREEHRLRVFECTIGQYVPAVLGLIRT